METNPLLHTPRLRMRASLLCVCICLLAFHLPLPLMGQANYATPYTITTLAGLTHNIGSADGTGSAARFNFPQGITVDTNGNLYVADTANQTIRQVTPAGVVTTLAGLAGFPGSTNGTGSTARFNNPTGVAVDAAGNLYVADAGSDTIRQVTPAGTNWVVTTLAGLAGFPGSANGTGSIARFNNPTGVAVDSVGNLYVADNGNNTIRQLTPSGTNWAVTTLAGLAGSFGSTNGTGSAARFGNPTGVAVDTAGNLYVVDKGNDMIRKVTPTGTNWVVTTLAGGGCCSADGTGSAARFNQPFGVAADSAGNLYVTDRDNSTIRKVTPAGTNWVVTTLAGLSGPSGTNDGTGSIARFNNPYGVAVDSAGNIYVADSSNDAIRKGFLASSVPAPTLTSPNLNPGQFRFGITGLPNLAVDIQSSTDLSHWQVVGTNILIGGSNYFVTTNQSQGSRFYRAHVR